MPEIKDSSTNLSNVTQAHEVPSDQEFYLIGIGGAGMSVLALLLHDLGIACPVPIRYRPIHWVSYARRASQFLWDTGRTKCLPTPLWW